MEPIILNLSFLILIALGLAFVARFLRQPIILAYIVTGALVAYFGFFDVQDQEAFHVFADLGIMFLLFLVGLEISLNSLKVSGKTSVLVGLGQIAFTFGVGFAIAILLGFAPLPASYIAIALTFSSTIIIIKLLSDKKDLNSLYGRISVGFLLVQDFVAILILIFLAGISAGGDALFLDVVLAIVQGLLLFAIIVWLSKYVFPPLLDKIAKSQELLFLFSLAWAFGLAAAVDQLGFSIEIAGFLAGVALANSSENLQIASRIRPLRDFFILVFFFILGSMLVMSDFAGVGWPILIFSLFVLIGNPLIVLAIMGSMGYRSRTGFLAGVTVAQISEFSLIVAALGFRLGHIDGSVLGLVTAVGVITIAVSSYLITNAEIIYPKIAKIISIFERKIIKENPVPDKKIQKPIVLIGCNRTGQSIASGIPKKDLLIVDFDPEIIKSLDDHGYDNIFGDIRDSDIFEAANIAEADVVISTSPDIEDNLALASEINRLIKKPKMIIRADDDVETKVLYEAGVDYVLQPHFASGQHIGHIVSEGINDKSLKMLKESDKDIKNKIFKNMK